MQGNILACAHTCTCGRLFLYVILFMAPGLLYSSELCVHACTLHPRTFLKTSRKQGIPLAMGYLCSPTRFPWLGTRLCSVQPCLGFLCLYLTLRINDAFPCVGYTVASPCFGLHFFSVCWTRTAFFSRFFCVCANTYIHVEAQERCWTSPLWPSILFS